MSAWVTLCALNRKCSLYSPTRRSATSIFSASPLPIQPLPQSAQAQWRGASVDGACQMPNSVHRNGIGQSCSRDTLAHATPTTERRGGRAHHIMSFSGMLFILFNEYEKSGMVNTLALRIKLQNETFIRCFLPCAPSDDSVLNVRRTGNEATNQRSVA